MKPKDILFLIMLLAVCSCRQTAMVKSGDWSLTCKDGVSISHSGTAVVSNMLAEYSLNGKLYSSKSYTDKRFSLSDIDDEYGKGKEWTIVYSADNLPKMHQTFRIYDDYVLTNISLSSEKSLETNYMAPIVVDATDNMISSSSLRRLMVPFDNDAWIRYKSVKETGDTLRSYEVTSVYDSQNRNGVVIGAVDHSTWKNAIDFLDNASRMKVYSGVADALTRDRLAHGSVRGDTVRSATMMIGVFDDWREGMETFADVNAIKAKPRQWNKAVPVGWNSWGALQFNVNHTNSTETASFFAEELQPRSFCNSDGLVYTGLDSGWNNFSDEDLKDFADRCKALNQVPCIYWTPFTDWGKNPERPVPHAEQYKYKDIYLYANGSPQELDGAYAIDPTHPAVKAMMEATADLFRRNGYKYVKMDFMTHGRMEADRWYSEDISTGTEAYNYGMHLLDSIFHDMYLNLSISPVFPAQYAQSRRIACDAWNKIKDTEYTMNALSFGWWIDRVYQFNDADHVVLRDATEGENRARITSSVITGLFITGDDFSVRGDSLAKARALRYLTNPDINRIATGESFRPLNGDNDDSENSFVRKEADGNVYLVVFNYSDDDLRQRLPLDRLDLESEARYAITELWSHSDVSSDSEIAIPSKDVKVFLFKKL